MSAIILCALTVLLFESVDHHQVVGSQLLVNHSFDQGIQGWRGSRSLDPDQIESIELTNQSNTESRYLYQVVAKPSDRVLLQAGLEIIDVEAGPLVWHKARN